MEKKKRDTDNFCYPLPWRVVVAVADVAVVERRFVNKTFLGVQSTLVFVPTGSVFCFVLFFFLFFLGGFLFDIIRPLLKNNK
jgi:hypothetical protein